MSIRFGVVDCMFSQAFFHLQSPARESGITLKDSVCYVRVRCEPNLFPHQSGKPGPNGGHHAFTGESFHEQVPAAGLSRLHLNGGMRVHSGLLSVVVCD
jgi:hypothetical protein